MIRSLIFILAVFLEGMVTTFPLTLLGLLLFTVIYKKKRVFLIAFLSGILLDIFSLRSVGGTSLFFLCFLFLILLYERKYEIATVPFVGISAFLGASIYLGLQGYHFIFTQAILSSIMAVILLLLLRRFVK